jgi:ketosteroid isomerase-like protein
MKESTCMRKLLLLLVCAPILFSAPPPEEAVRAAEKTFATALVHQDAAALEGLLSPELSYGHASGKLDSKRTYIDRIRSGAQKYVSFKYDSAPQVVHIYGDTATLVASAQVQSITDGQPNTLNLRFLHVWVHGGAGWQLAAHQSVKLP